VYLYRRNHGVCPSSIQEMRGQRHQIDGLETSNTQHPEQLSTGGVWRNEPLEMKAPEYTKRPSQGECSLGLGRRKSEIEEYEFRNMRPSEDMRTGTGGFSHAPILERQEVAGDIPSTTTTTTTTTTTDRPVDRPVDSLPPYLPPPSPVVARSSVENHRHSQRSFTALPARPNSYQ
jgi:hypothetical protein